jgi:hypothetical protein
MLIEDTQCLEMIERLYQLRLDQYISLLVVSYDRVRWSTLVTLHQLAVVCDQSGGKNPVLESLADLPLPQDSSPYTRFLMRMVF